MTTELTKAAQQALMTLRRAVPKDSEQAHEQLLAVQALNTALTQRPAPAPAPAPAVPELPDGVTLEDLLIPLRAALNTCHDTDWSLRQFKTHITHALAALQSAQPAPAVPSDERTAFETEMRCEETWGHRSLKKRPDGRYLNWQVELMWHVWQARAAIDAVRAAEKGGE